MFGFIVKSVTRLDSLFGSMFQPINPYRIDKLKRIDLEPIAIEESKIKRTTTRLIVISFTAFSVWAVYAPLNDGVAVQGTVAVQGARKAVQHPNGGVVTTINVKEGERVTQGQVLLTVNPLTTEANLNSQELDYYVALAAESRLISERLDKPRIEWIPELEVMESKDPRVLEAKKIQENLFYSRRQELESKLRILNAQITASSTAQKELQDIMNQRKSQLATVTKELNSNAALAKEGFVTRSKVSELEVQRSSMLASISQLNSEVAQNTAQVSSARLQVIEAQASYRKTIDTELSEVQKNRKSLSATVDSLKFDRQLAEVKSPVTGTVVGLKVNTVGGVIKGGDLLMEVVPEDGKLVVQARVPPRMIDKVFVGSEADMRFTAFNRATTPVIPGVVKLVGADLIAPNALDPVASASGYYLAHVETSTAKGIQEAADLQLQPGMPVEVMVKTGERSFLSLLTKPLTDRFAKAFNEDN